MILQPPRGTAPPVAKQTGKLLPHLLTLTPIAQGGSFLLPYSALTNSHPLGGGALCVVRTFLSFPCESSDRPIDYSRKGSDLFRLKR